MKKARVELAVGLAFLAAMLGTEIHCTRHRNEVWRDEQSLWSDAAKKAPNDGRAWMNLGVAVMAKGDFSALRRSISRWRSSARPLTRWCM